MTLEEAIAAALRNNLRLAQEDLTVQQRELDVEQAKSEFEATYGPFVQVAAPDGQPQTAYGLQVSKPFSLGTTVGVSTTVLSDQKQDGATLAVELTQPLFRRFGREATEEPIHAGADQLRAARRLWEIRKADLVLSIVSLFETITRFDAQAEFEKQFCIRMEQLSTLTRTRERQGRATRMDTLRVDLQQGEAEIRQTNVRERRAMAARELAEAIGADVRQEISLIPPPLLDATLPEPEAAIAAALIHRMDIAQVLDDEVVAGRRESIANRTRWPDITLGLSLLQKYKTGLEESADGEETAWFASASADGYPWKRSDRLLRSEAKLERQSARTRIEIARKTLVREVLQALAECRRTEVDLVIAGRNRELAIQAARLGRRFYTTGRADGLSMSDAESQLATAEIRLLETRSAARFSRYALTYTLGTLIEHPADLIPVQGKEGSP